MILGVEGKCIVGIEGVGSHQRSDTPRVCVKVSVNWLINGRIWRQSVRFPVKSKKNFVEAAAGYILVATSSP